MPHRTIIDPETVALWIMKHATATFGFASGAVTLCNSAGFDVGRCLLAIVGTGHGVRRPALRTYPLNLI